MANVKWTEAQEKFLSAKRGPVLVSAAAGSGKTAAVVERVIRRLCDKNNPLYADRLLMTTFTNAAAAEMLNRIQASIREKLFETPDDLFLQKQADDIERAQIGTIHSFCIKLLRENFFKLNIFSDFKIADETDNQILFMDAINKVVAKGYEEKSEVFYSLVENICGSRSDTALKEVLEKLYYTVIAMPFPMKVLDNWLEKAEPNEENYIIRADIIIGECVDKLSVIINLLQQGLSLVDDEAQVKIVNEEIKLLIEFLDLLKARNLKDAFEVSKSLKFLNNGKMLKAPDDFKKMRETIKNSMKEITNLLEYSDIENFINDQKHLYPMTECLFSLVRKLIEEFSNLKREKNVVDFSDVEQMTLQLLWQDDLKTTSKLAEEISSRYDEIYIDEYQDINAAQEKIFEAITPKSNNIFMVGDAKQGIYGFRQTDTTIFNNKQKEFAAYDGKTFPSKIFFDANFRSRNSVTEFINGIFSSIMNEETCDMNYDEKQSLKAKGSFPDSDEAGATMLFYESMPKSRETVWIVDEANVVASEITRLVNNGYMVNDKGTMRPCRYGDFCIIIRSGAEKFAVYQEVLSGYGIDAVNDKEQTTFLDSREILIIRSVLKAISNPYDDIALCAAMLSPIFLFTPTDLAEIRMLKEKKSPLFDAVKSAAECGVNKCQDFLKKFRELQRLSACKSVDELLSIIYNRHGFYNMAAAMSSGDERTANLDMMRHYSRIFEQNGYKGIGSFIKFVEKIGQNGGVDLSGAPLITDNSNKVRIITIHKSKGLEFPVCILGGVYAAFNEKDITSAYIVNKDFGFTCKIVDAKRGIKYDPFAYRFMQYILRQEQRAEEMRMLYVALTRAKEKLIIPIVKTKIADELSNAVYFSSDELVNNAVKIAKSYLKWILLATARGSSLKGVCNALSAPSLGVKADIGFSARIVTDFLSPDVTSEIEREKTDGELIEKIGENALFEYPFKAQTGIVSKYSVSELVKGNSEEIFDFEASPDFMCEEGVGGAERGTALHTFMQFANLENAKENIDAELKRVLNKGFITEKQYSIIEKDKLERFFSSPVFSRILKADAVFREYKFMTGVDSSIFGGDRNSQDNVVIQGVADCVLVEGKEITIVDYKTDYVKDGQTLVDRYSMQLSYYKEAIEKMLGLPVKQCLIFSFCLGKEIEIENNNLNLL